MFTPPPPWEPCCCSPSVSDTPPNPPCCCWWWLSSYASKSRWSMMPKFSAWCSRATPPAPAATSTLTTEASDPASWRSCALVGFCSPPSPSPTTSCWPPRASEAWLQVGLGFRLPCPPLPSPPSWPFISSTYISSTIGFHSRTLALMNQLDTCHGSNCQKKRARATTTHVVYLRVQEVLEEPGTEDGDGAVGKAALGAPRVAVHGGDALQRLVVPDALVDHPEPRRLPPRRPGRAHVLLPERLPRRLQLRHDPIPQAPEVPRYRPRRHRRVRPRRPLPGHRLEPPGHRPHLLAVPPVPPVHL
ncbi:Os03g0124033, partial [Oryza sativa Japonica Group]